MLQEEILAFETPERGNSPAVYSSPIPESSLDSVHQNKEDDNHADSSVEFVKEVEVIYLSDSSVTD